jgi:putative membrane protein
MERLINLLLSGVAVYASAYLLPGAKVDNYPAALITAIVLAIANTIIKPLLQFLAFPITLLTLGLFSFVINALIVILVAYVVPGFSVDSFLTALLFSLILSVITTVINALT